MAQFVQVDGNKKRLLGRFPHSQCALVPSLSLRVPILTLVDFRQKTYTQWVLCSSCFGFQGKNLLETFLSLSIFLLLRQVDGQIREIGNCVFALRTRDFLGNREPTPQKRFRLGMIFPARVEAF